MSDPADFDVAVRVTVPETLADTVGAVLMERLGPFQEEPAAEPTTVARPQLGGEPSPVARSASATTPSRMTLVFYPPEEAVPSDEELVAALPSEARASGLVMVERTRVPRDWVDGWKAHFRPITIGEVKVRPPWEPAPPGGTFGSAGAAAAASSGPVDVVINPGQGFGTGLHPTTRGVLLLLQEEPAEGIAEARSWGPVVDVGTGSGILAIAAAKLGWGPVFAFDNDSVALASARENVEANGVRGIVEMHLVDLTEASPYWFAGATVLANLTLGRVVSLLRRIAREAPGLRGEVEAPWPVRLVVSGILAGEQEREATAVAAECGFTAGRRVHEEDWVTLELLPAAGAAPDSTAAATGAADSSEAASDTTAEAAGTPSAPPEG